MEISRTDRRDEANSNERKTNFEVSRTKSEVTLTVKGDSIDLFVDKAEGIDSLTLTRKQMKWPESITVRLAVSGLEDLTLSSGGKSISGAVTGSKIFTMKTGNQEEIRIDETSDDWPDVSIRSSAKTIPIKDGYFEIRIPSTLLSDDDPQLRVSWIDFYR